MPSPATFREWLLEQEKNESFSLKEMALYGCQNGFSGLIYYNETSELYDNYQDDIWEINQSYAEDMGWNSALDLFAGYSPSKEFVTTLSMFKNTMVWSAAEILAQLIVSERGED